MHKIILDTDPGVDDAMAIAYALLHPDIELLGLTTVFGNNRVDLCTRNAQYILDTFGAEDVAVAQGAKVPTVQKPWPFAEMVHGADGLGNVYPGSTSSQPAREPVKLAKQRRHAQLEPLDAADYIISMVHRFPGEISLVAVGPLTNIAIALRREPDLPNQVRQLVVMGGAVDEPGNVTPLAEANFFNDPHAADEVLAAHWPVHIVGLDVTHQIMIRDQDMAMLNQKAGATGSLLWNSSRFYMDFYTQSGAAREAVATGAQPQCAMHDAAAIARLLLSDAFTEQTGAARVVPDGMAAGQLAIDRKGYDYMLPDWQSRPRVSVCMGVEAERVRQHFLETIITFHRC